LFAKFDKWTTETIAYENLQARIRGCILMSLSNQYDFLVLNTSNKSETAVGYATLYGDTAGGFSILKDIPKTMVYQFSLSSTKRKAISRRIQQPIHFQRCLPTQIV